MFRIIYCELLKLSHCRNFVYNNAVTGLDIAIMSQVAVDMGTMTFEEIRGSEDRSKLLKVLGDNEKLNIKKFYQPIQIENGDAFLICSDGFWDFVTEGEMEADLLKAENAPAWLRFMLKRQLLRAKNEDDNYTAVSGIFGGEEAAVIPVKKSKAPYIALCAAALVLAVFLIVA